MTKLPPMTPDEIRNIVHRCVAQCSPDGSTIADDSTLGGLKFDSLDVVELQLLIEMEFSHGRGLAFHEVADAWNGSTTVKAIVARTVQLLAGAA